MMEGRGYELETVLITPRPLSTRVALPVIIKPSARRVLQILIGSKFAFNTNTGTCIVSSTTFANYSTGFTIGKSAQIGEPDVTIWNNNSLFLDSKIDL
jgi:hypothetical protein